jgi:outer membrane protein assembly factor BamB
VVGDTVYFTTESGDVIARRRTTGDAIWSTRIAGEQIGGGNVIARKGVVVVSTSYETVGLRSSTGAILWRYSAPLDTTGANQPYYAGVVLGNRLDADDANVYIPAWGASVGAVNLQTGQVQWVWQPHPVPVFRSGAEGVRISGDTLFVTAWHYVNELGGQSEPWLVTLDRRTGRELSRVVLPAYASGVLIRGAPAVSGNLVIVAPTGGREWAIDRTSGQIVWSFTPQTQTASVSQPEVWGDTVYHYGGDMQVYALAAVDGRVLWHTPIQGMAIADLLATSQYLYVTNGPDLLILNRHTGQLVTQNSVPHSADGIFGSAAVADNNGRIFITTSSGAECLQEP